MLKTNLQSRRVAGAVVSALGSALAFRWVFQTGMIARLLPGSASLGLNAPLMLMALGAALCCSTVPQAWSGRRRHLTSFLLAFVAGMAGLVLCENLFSIDLGIDLARGQGMPTAQTPYPGRVAPNTCVAFLLASLAIWLARRQPPGRSARRVMTGAVVGVIGLSVSGLVGHVLNLSALYQFATYNRMLLPTALGLFVLSLGLWFLLQHVMDAGDDSVGACERRITRRSAGIMAAVAVSTGVAGFAVIEAGFEQSISQNLVSTTVANGAALSAALESRLWLSRSIQTRPSIRHAFHALRRNPADASARQALREVGDALVASGLNEIEFRLQDGTLVARSGQARAGDAPLRMQLTPRDQVAFLAWKDGYFLQTESGVAIDPAFTGRIVMEQALPTFQTLIAAIEQGNASAEVLICGRTPNDGLCAPSRFYGRPRTIPLLNPDGTTNLPRVPPDLTRVATMRVKDLRGVSAQVVYTPLQNFGLGMAMKVDTESMLSPLREHVSRLALIIAGLVGIGTLLIRIQVMPILAKVAYEQSRNQEILASSNDAFVATDSDGKVTDWNARAESMFQVPAAEAIGRPLAAMLRSRPGQPVAVDGAALFEATGHGPVPSRTVEMLARRTDGTLFPVELSVTGFHDGRTHIANAFIRDITDRTKAEARLADRETFLRAITDTLPALIGYVNAAEIYEFANHGYRHMLGVDPQSIIGRSIRQVMGAEAYRLLEPRIRRVLGGEPVHFEQAIGLHSGIKHFLIDYLPKAEADGSVGGFYIMVLDVTARKRSEQALALSEERLRAVTDNLPALITHVDRNERYLFVSAHVERVFGRPASSMAGKTMRETTGAKLYAQISPHVRAVLRGTTCVFEGTVKTREKEILFQSTYLPEFGPDGDVCGFYAMTFDITERRRGELLLARSEERIRLITNNLPVLIAYIDTAHRIQFGNGTFKTWLGVDPARFIGRPVAELIGAVAYEQRRQYLDRALKGETVRFDMRSMTCGVERVLQTTYVPHVQGDGSIEGVYTISNDVTSLKAVEAELEKLARTDPLTGLPNRRRFEERMDEAIARSRRSGTPVALLFLDIDHFKTVNDTAGHATGDEVLRQLSRRLASVVRRTDMVARLAGDEFVIIVDGFKSFREVGLLAGKILAAASEPMRIDGVSKRVTVSIGGAMLTALDAFPETILGRADDALYAAKKAGRNAYREWLPEHSTSAPLAG